MDNKESSPEEQKKQDIKDKLRNMHKAKKGKEMEAYLNSLPVTRKEFLELKAKLTPSEPVRSAEEMTDLERVRDWAKCGIYHNHGHHEGQAKQYITILDSVISQFKEAVKGVHPHDPNDSWQNEGKENVYTAIFDWFQNEQGEYTVTVNEQPICSLRRRKEAKWLINNLRELPQFKEGKGEQRWISVKECLPDKSSIFHAPGHYVNEVLAATDKGRVYQTSYCSLGWANEHGETVTHWQPLPNPPGTEVQKVTEQRYTIEDMDAAFVAGRSKMSWEQFKKEYK